MHFAQKDTEVDYNVNDHAVRPFVPLLEWGGLAITLLGEYHYSFTPKKEAFVTLKFMSEFCDIYLFIKIIIGLTDFIMSKNEYFDCSFTMFAVGECRK